MLADTFHSLYYMHLIVQVFRSLKIFLFWQSRSASFAGAPCFGAYIPHTSKLHFIKKPVPALIIILNIIICLIF